MTYPSLLAEGITSEDAYVPHNMLAGEAKVTSASAIALVDIAQRTIIAINAAGQIVPWAPDAARVAVAGGAGGQTEVAPEAIPRGAASVALKAGFSGPYWDAGCFNIGFLIWPAAAPAGVAARKQLFAGRKFYVDTIG